MSEENKKSENQVEAKRPSGQVEQKPRCGYWVVAGIVCFTKEQMREALAGFRECVGR